MATRSSKDEDVSSSTTKLKSGESMTTSSQSLSHELIVEILSWLPIKHLSPLRCVTKTWLHLLTRDALFAKLQFERAIQLKSSPSVVVKRRNLQRYYFAADHTTCDHAVQLELPFQQDSICYAVYGICNGLLCLTSPVKDELYIWNPITNDHITIPYPPTPSRFPGLDTGTRVAFGFHPGTNEYKVLKVFSEDDYSALQFHSQVSVCTLGIDSTWRTVVDDIPYNMICGSVVSPLVHGSIHWLSMTTGSFSFSAIVAFDLKYESFQEIPPPKDVNFNDASSYKSIAELGGQLCLFFGHDCQDVQIWAMKLYGVADSWSKLFTVGRPEVEGFFTFLRPLGIVAHNGDIILKKNMTDLFLYHPETKSISYLANFGFEIFDAYAYIGSIISPRAISGASHTTPYCRPGVTGGVQLQSAYHDCVVFMCPCQKRLGESINKCTSYWRLLTAWRVGGKFCPQLNNAISEENTILMSLPSGSGKSSA